MPDDPSLPADKIAFNERKELFATFETLLLKIELFAGEVYQVLCHDVREEGMQM